MTTYDKRLRRERASINQAARLLRGLRQIAETDLSLAIDILANGWPLDYEMAREVLTDTEAFADFLEGIEDWVTHSGGSPSLRRRVTRTRKLERRLEERATLNREGAK